MSMSPAFDPRSGRGREQEFVRETNTTRVEQPIAYNAAAPMVSQPIVRDSVGVVARRDSVRWGPILAGLVSALSTLILLSLLGAAVGLTAASGSNATAATNNAGSYGVGAAIWAAIAALISFFIGGYIAARTAAVGGKGNGWLNGALVWAVTIPLLLWLATSGASGLLNALGFNIGGFIQNISNTVNNPATNPVNNNPGAVQSTVNDARNGAWGALAALLIGLIAAGLGGLLGTRPTYGDGLNNENDNSVNR